MWRIAVHECGHAIMAVAQDLGTLRRVRLGLKDGDTELLHDTGAGLRRDHHNMLIYTLGGRAAESVIFKSIGSGSGGLARSCDLARATRSALAMETSFGFGAQGLIWSAADSGNGIDDPALRETIQKTLEAAEDKAKHMLEEHRVLLLEMSKDLMRKRILEGADLEIWVDRITGDAPWDPDDPFGRRKRMAEDAMQGSATIFDLDAHRDSSL
jgi:ATP-dependent Zn protease